METEHPVSIEAPSAPALSRSQTPPARSIQAYIDETPMWSDGTPLPWAPMTAMQWRIWMLAAAGKFFEGLVVFMTGVAMPLIAEEFGLTRIQHGIVSAATLFGILIGAIGLGGLSDHFGRRAMFIVEMIIFVIFLVLLVASPGYYLLVVFLFGLGLALGCDYPTAHLIISESIPSQARGRLVLAAFGFQALGALTGTIVGYVVLKNIPELGAWRWMYATAIIPAVLVTIGRFSVTESAHWLLVRGRDDDARAEVARLLARMPPHPKIVELAGTALVQSRRSVLALFEKANRRATVLASIPWFLQDLGTYGIGMFTPTILAASIGHKAAHVRNLADLVGNEELAAKGAALIDVLLIVGIIGAIALVDRIGSIRLQVWGFVGCAAGLLIAAASTFTTGAAATPLIFAGFMLFNFMTNLGPNAQTYLLAGEVFPTHVRGTGAGFAAAFAKIGAVTTAFLFPMLLADIGTRTLLLILAGTSVLGAFVTSAFRIETTGVSLEQIGAEADAAANAHAQAGARPPTGASPSPAEETAS
jgi:MFS transporter, putative metabolite transport protein